MTVATVGRAKKPAKRQNYKIAYDALAVLKGIAVLEDRSDTAQLERWIRESADRWRLENPAKVEQLDKLTADFLATEGVEAEVPSDISASVAKPAPAPEAENETEPS
ncbi:MAG: hypothetical protein ACAF41_12585 [Leptolyngbya sp. BL-A-14]